MKHVGIDIGSTASKVAIMDDDKREILYTKLLPSGWNSRETGEEIKKWIESLNLGDVGIVATGYGRISVPYADKTVTEITCHAKGALFLNPKDMTVIDIGGQDTKVIVVEDDMVSDFLMNDKCSAGTGKFLEVMANRLGLTLHEMFEFAKKGEPVPISSVCTVFAESEIISLMGKGTPREDIACGVVQSIVKKVAALSSKRLKSGDVFLTGGFCDSDYVIDELSKELGATVHTDPRARFAGAIGAALLA
ncbi:acyl-CoA dehydratase activase [Ezakiella coagulans]|uniref:acyl-CoA dehydratase activase n=1 Tax=Ezakiella coagulans TaxID=46507 RepID=UPI002014E60E|nr:acyl-CoA dehydratase activase [Ezakiella coagulans]UQK61590.1 acyl-CoA dehydratase activase [Ezakiella coagulans]